MSRINKDKYYLDIAEVVLTRSTCMNKHWGAVLVKDDTILSTGFNGAPRGVKDCYEHGFCRLYEYRRKNNLGRGTAYEQCISCHAEMNAIVFVHDKSLTEGSTLYLVGKELTDLDENNQKKFQIKIKGQEIRNYQEMNKIKDEGKKYMQKIDS